MTIYSYSRLKCYEQCPQKYKLQYIDKVKTEIKESIECFLGRRVHEALKKLYCDLQYQKENTLEDLLAFLRTRWAKNWNDSIVIVKKKYSPEYCLEMAEKCIIYYYSRYKPFNHGRTIALEERFLINLNDSEDYKLCGYIDRITKSRDGCYEIHDYKTNSRLPSVKQIENDRQLALYTIGVKHRYPNVKKVKMVWHFLKFNKEINMAKTDEELNKLKQNTIKLIETIEAAKEFPTNPSGLCSWCKFKSICR